MPGVRDPERVEPVAEPADAALVAEPSGKRADGQAAVDSAGVRATRRLVRP